MWHVLIFKEDAVNVHVGLLKLPPAPPSLHATVPVGVVAVPLSISATAALNVIVLPIVTDDGFGVMVVVVLRGPTVNADWPELVACVLSPE